MQYIPHIFKIPKRKPLRKINMQIILKIQWKQQISTPRYPFIKIHIFHRIPFLIKILHKHILKLPIRQQLLYLINHIQVHIIQNPLMIRKQVLIRAPVISKTIQKLTGQPICNQPKPELYTKNIKNQLNRNNIIRALPPFLIRRLI